MKSKYLLLTGSLLLTISSFGQKDELKTAEKQFKKGNLPEADTALSQAESVLSNATDEEKAKYYYLKGGLSLAYAKIKNKESENLKKASESYLKLTEIENKIGKDKYGKQAEVSVIELRNELVKSAVSDNEKQSFDTAASKLYSSYTLNKKDTIHLYYAASSAVSGKHYETALQYYKELAKLGFTGKKTSYTAINKSTNAVENFGETSQVRDLAVKQGTHINPKTEKEESKRGEIVKNIALIYNLNGDKENAKKAILDARKENPDDIGLMITEANMYLDAKEMDKYQDLIKQAIAKDPNNADLYYNLGVVSANSNNTEDAKKYYTKAIEINPELENAYQNLAGVLLEAQKDVITQMNKLGNSASDNKKYEELKVKNENILKSAIPHLEKVIQLNPSNSDAGTTLANIYSLLGQYEKAKALKAKFAK